jgi:inositol oxygenase
LCGRSRAEFLGLQRQRLSPFGALEYLNTLIDDSDPDIELDQLQHLLQCAEAIRADGHEDWFVLERVCCTISAGFCVCGGSRSRAVVG